MRRRARGHGYGTCRGSSRGPSTISQLPIARGDAESGARLAGAAASLRARVGATTRQAFEHECLHHDLAQARVALRDEFDVRYDEGRVLDANAAVALALTR